jgi:hypothetical protein
VDQGGADRGDLGNGVGARLFLGRQEAREQEAVGRQSDPA